MRLLDTGFVAAWRDRMVNIHPSLLPAFRACIRSDRRSRPGSSSPVHRILSAPSR